jgi:putative flippase GtrA
MKTPFLSEFISTKFLRFLMAGGVAAALQWGSRFGFSQLTTYSNSVLLAYLVGLISGFILSRVFVFQSTSGSLGKQALLFVLVNLAGLPLVWGLSIFLGTVFLPNFLAEFEAQALGNGIAILSPVAVNFILHKYFTFRNVETR